MNDDAPLSADHVPTLTEVVELGMHADGFPPGDLPAEVLGVLGEEAPAAPASHAAAPPAPDLLEHPPLHLYGSSADVLASSMIPVQPEIDAQVLVGQVLAELSPRIDMMFQARLREALAPALARAADSLIRDTRDEMAATLRELVQEAVTRALQRRADL